MSCALELNGKILNWRFGGGQSLLTPPQPAFEWRRPDEIGPDESCHLHRQSNGLYAAKSPNGKTWLSRQPDTSLQERATSDVGQPGPWEQGPYDPTSGLWAQVNGEPWLILGQPENGGGGGGSGPEKGFLHADGHALKTENGADWLFAGYTMHTLSSSSVQGADLNAILDEPVALGYNTLVVINMHLSDWKHQNGFVCDPFAVGYGDAIARMYEACAARGLRVAAAVLADCQGLSQSQYLDVWHRNIEIARGRWNVLLRGGNEDKANGWDCDVLDRPQNMGGVLCSRGSRGIDVPPSQHYWDWIEWEGRRDPGIYHKCLDDAGSGGLELLAGYDGVDGPVGPFPCPMIQIEPPYFHDDAVDMFGDHRWTDPKAALHLGLSIAGNGPGGAFGASNPLVCRPIGNGRARECAEQFIRGLRAGFVRPIPTAPGYRPV